MSGRLGNRVALTALVGVVLVAVALAAVFTASPGLRDGGQRATFDNSAPVAAVMSGRDVATRLLPAVLLSRVADTHPQASPFAAARRGTSVAPATSLIVRPLRI